LYNGFASYIERRAESEVRTKESSNIGPETMRSMYEQREAARRRPVEVRTRDCCKNLGRLVHRGEMPIEHGDSWFSAKAIKVARLKTQSGRVRQ